MISKSRSRRHDRRRLYTLLTISLISLALGLGNIVFAKSKYEEYFNILNNAEQQIAKINQPLDLSNSNFGEDQLNTNLRYINKLKSRLGFYEFVIYGGRYLLLFSAAFLLLTALQYFRDYEDDSAEI